MLVPVTAALPLVGLGSEVVVRSVSRYVEEAGGIVVFVVVRRAVVSCYRKLIEGHEHVGDQGVPGDISWVERQVVRVPLKHARQALVGHVGVDGSLRV